MDVLQIFGSVSVYGCDFNNVAKRLRLLRLHFCIVLLWVCFVFAEHLSWRAPLEDCFWANIVLCSVFNLFFLVKYTFDDFKFSYWQSFCKESEMFYSINVFLDYFFVCLSIAILNGFYVDIYIYIYIHTYIYIYIHIYIYIYIYIIYVYIYIHIYIHVYMYI